MFVVFVFSHAPMYGPQAAFLSEMFGTRVRYSGASLGAQLASVLAGGLSPFIATALLASYGRNALVVYLMFMAAVTIVAVVAGIRDASRRHWLGFGLLARGFTIDDTRTRADPEH